MASFILPKLFWSILHLCLVSYKGSKNKYNKSTYLRPYCFTFYQLNPSCFLFSSENPKLPYSYWIVYLSRMLLSATNRKGIILHISSVDFGSLSCFFGIPSLLSTYSKCCCLTNPRHSHFTFFHLIFSRSFYFSWIHLSYLWFPADWPESNCFLCEKGELKSPKDFTSPLQFLIST